MTALNLLAQIRLFRENAWTPWRRFETNSLQQRSCTGNDNFKELQAECVQDPLMTCTDRRTQRALKRWRILTPHLIRRLSDNLFQTLYIDIGLFHIIEITIHSEASTEYELNSQMEHYACSSIISMVTIFFLFKIVQYLLHRAYKTIVRRLRWVRVSYWCVQSVKLIQNVADAVPIHVWQIWILSKCKRED